MPTNRSVIRRSCTCGIFGKPTTHVVQSRREWKAHQQFMAQDKVNIKDGNEGPGNVQPNRPEGRIHSRSPSPIAKKAKNRTPATSSDDDIEDCIVVGRLTGPSTVMPTITIADAEPPDDPGKTAQLDINASHSQILSPSKDPEDGLFEDHINVPDFNPQAPANYHCSPGTIPTHNHSKSLPQLQLPISLRERRPQYVQVAETNQSVHQASESHVTEEETAASEISSSSPESSTSSEPYQKHTHRPAPPRPNSIEDTDDHRNSSAYSSLDSEHSTRPSTPEFNYEHINKEPSQKDLMDLALFDIKTSGTTSRTQSEAYTSIIKTISPPECSPATLKTTIKRLIKRTGIQATPYNCCRDSCYCFYEDAEITHCPECHQARWRPGTRQAYKQYQYYQIIPRIQLQYSDPARAKEFTQYRKEVKTWGDHNPGAMKDYWNSRLHETWRKQGYFQNPETLAFLLSTDGFRVFFRRKRFSAWPLLLIPLNVSPTTRKQRRNLLPVGIIPGPK